MVLPVTTTVCSCTEAPPHGLSLSGAFHFVVPLAVSRQYSARSPSFSWSRKAEQTRTRSPARLTGASTCQTFSPCCHSLRGLARGNWSSLGEIGRAHV